MIIMRTLGSSIGCSNIGPSSLGKWLRASEGAVLYRGSVSPDYETDPDDCIYSAIVVLTVETGGD